MYLRSEKSKESDTEPADEERVSSSDEARFCEEVALEDGVHGLPTAPSATRYRVYDCSANRESASATAAAI